MKRKGNKIQIKEVLKFLVGGGSAVVIDYSVYRMLLAAGWGLSPSKAAAYACGAAAGFVINKLWTFQSRGFSRQEIIKYVLLYAFSACVNVAVNKTVLMGVPVQAAGYLCATGASTAINFLGQKFFVFVKEGNGR